MKLKRAGQLGDWWYFKDHKDHEFWEWTTYPLSTNFRNQQDAQQALDKILKRFPSFTGSIYLCNS